MPDNDRNEPNPATKLLKEFRAAHGDVPFGSLEEINEALAAFVAKKNSEGLEEFMGLSPAAMHALQHHFFRTVQVAERVSTVPPALPFIVLDALLETGMDNAEPHDELPDPPLDFALDRLASMMLFHDLDEDNQVELLDMAFLLLRTSGIVQRRKKRFSIHPRFSERVRARDYGPLYPHLFRTLSTAGNWGLSTPVVFEPFFGFTLYQLHRAQGADIPLSTFVGQFYDAFPFIFEDLMAEETEDSIPGLLPVVAFFVSVVVNYWGMLGLVEEIGFENDAVLRPHPVLQELLSFPDEWAG